MIRQGIVLIAACAVLGACSDDGKKPRPSTQEDAGTLSGQGLSQPGRLERPPSGTGLPADLKPPVRQ
ncbi:hypothetical protein [Myxococcus stipitatus]|uniref:hypothetical protein n=1 Tax=Myxococcus stipitatus TaxID=83455 RepID=UPI0030D3443D